LYAFPRRGVAGARLHAAGAAIGGACLCGVLAGCAQSNPQGQNPAQPAPQTLAGDQSGQGVSTRSARAQVRAKPRDVDPALSHVLPAFSLAVEFAETRPGTSPRLIRLVGLHGEEGTITILHDQGDGSLRFLRTEVDMTIEARIGLAASTRRAQDLAEALAERLKELAKQE
jgi:hypothetical protein